MADIHTLDIRGIRDDEQISRYLDREMEAEEIRAFESRLNDEPQLRQRLQALSKNDDVIRALANQDNIEVPPAVVARIEAVPARRWLSQRTGVMAVAASMTLAVAVSLQTGQTPELPGTPTMSPQIASALETLPSRAEGWDALADGTELRAVLTFPAADGAWCREFMLASTEGHWRGVACRHDGSWVTQVMGRELFLEQGHGYRPAGAQTEDSVARFIDATAVDVALSPDTEQSLLDKGWPEPAGHQ